MVEKSSSEMPVHGGEEEWLEEGGEDSRRQTSGARLRGAMQKGLLLDQPFPLNNGSLGADSSGQHMLAHRAGGAAAAARPPA